MTVRLKKIRLISSGVVAVLLCASAAPIPAAPQNEDARSPAPTSYSRTLGPYSIDGASFTVKLSVICYKGTRHAGPCNEDDEETVKSMKIEDEAGKTCFHTSFPVAFAHQVERHVVAVARLEGHDHQALELQFEKLPSHANTGISIQLFGVRDGTLQAFNDDPFEFYGGLGDLPMGSSKDSRRLLDGDALPIFLLTNYFYIEQRVRVNWKDFRLEPQETGEFEVAQQSPYSRKPDIEADGYIHLYASPDQNASQAGLSVTPQSSVQVLRAIFRGSPSEEHSSASDTWLQVSVDGKVGWIVGLDDYTALGLSAAH
ncbi:MAG: hypothetical protein ABSA57_19070 [Candidatus Acidiferrales bacterium]